MKFSYNETIENGEFLKELFMQVYNKNLLEVAGVPYKTKLAKVIITSDKNPEERFNSGYYFHIKLVISFTDTSSGDKHLQEIEFDMPKMYKNAFFYLKRDGSFRTKTPVTSLIKQDNIKVNKDGYVVINDKNFRFSFKIGTNDLLLKLFEDADEIQFRNGLEALETIKSKFGEEALRLSDKYINKLKILGYDYEFIDLNLIRDIIDINVEDRRNIFETKTPYDYKFVTFLDEFKEEVLANRYEITRRMQFNMRKYGKIYSTDIVKILNRLLNIDSDSVRSSSHSNPLSELSVSNRLIYRGGNVYEPRFIYNDTFFGVMSPTKTPDSGNTGIFNEFSKSSVLINGIPHIKVYDKNEKEVYIEPVEFLTKKILYWNEWKRIKNKEKAPYKIFYKRQEDEIVNADDFDYIMAPLDNYLSLGESIIPFSNHSDTQRIAGGANLLDQSISCRDSNPSILYTGGEKDIYELSTDKIKSIEKGIVEEVTENYVKVSGKKYNFFNAPNSNRVLNQMVPKVKIGQKVKEGDVIIESNSFKDGEFATGVNLLTAFTEYRGATYREGIAISESCAKKLSHQNIKIKSFYLGNKNEYVFGKEGKEELKKWLDNKIKQKEINKRFQYNEEEWDSKYNFLMEGTYSTLVLGGLVYKTIDYTKLRTDGDTTKYMVDPLFLSPYLKDGEVIDCWVEHISITDDGSGLNDSLVPLAKQFRKNKKAIVTDELPKDIGMVIHFKLKYWNYCGVGSKVTTSYYNKGTVAKVVPDDEFLHTEDGKVIDIIYGALSIPNRKTVALAQELSLTKSCKIGYEKVGEWLKSNSWQRVKEFLNLLYNTKEFSNYTQKQLKEFYDTFSKYGYFRLKVSSWNREYSNDDILKIMEYLGVESKDYLIDGRTGKKVKKPVNVGYTRTYRVHMLAEERIAAFPKKNVINKEFTSLGSVKVREGGHSIGELQVMGLLATDNKLYDKITEDGRTHNLETINLELNLLGLEIVE